ncbi:MAG TPA: hypothetical protein VII83_00615 [Gaiellaceae bacterium]
MGDCESEREHDPIDWLLEKDNPSVRYFTLRDLLDKPEDDPAVIGAKRDIYKIGTVPAILAKQSPGGFWANSGSFYKAKYKGTVWQVLILAELGADRSNDRIASACEFLMDQSQDLESGGFSMTYAAKTGGGRHSEVIPCLTGNVVWSLIRLGYLDDPRIQRGIDWIKTFQRFDDGAEEPPQGWPYDRYEMCWGRHTCHMGVVKTLKALAAIPEDRRSAGVKQTLEKGVEYLLIHHVFKKSHDLTRVSKPGWLKLGFPLMYQTDVLEILGILARLNCRDGRMQEAIDLLVSKQDALGRWKLENTFNGKVQADIEQKGQPSKWVTLNALRILRNR